MKKLLVASSLVAVMLMTGFSQKGSAVSDSSAQGGANNSVVSAKDNFADMNAKAALIKELESQLKSVYFDFDRFNVRSDMQPVVEADARVLSSDKAMGLTVKIEGNTDEWGTDEYNYALGLKRAVSVRDALVAKGVDQAKTMTISFGESNQVCQDKSKECWSKNRRVDFKLVP